MLIWLNISVIPSPLCLAPRCGILGPSLSACRSTATHTTRVIESYGVTGLVTHFITMFIADPSSIEYTKVATPKFSFKNNNFLNVDLMMLNMPGMQNVPIGDLEIGENKVPCNCSMIKVSKRLNKQSQWIWQYFSPGAREPDWFWLLETLRGPGLHLGWSDVPEVVLLHGRLHRPVRPPVQTAEVCQESSDGPDGGGDRRQTRGLQVGQLSYSSATFFLQWFKYFFQTWQLITQRRSLNPKVVVIWQTSNIYHYIIVLCPPSWPILLNK